MEIYRLTAFKNKRSVYIEVGQHLQFAGLQSMNEQPRCCCCLLAVGTETGMRQETSFPLCSRYRLDPLLITCGEGARACRCLRVSRNGTGEDRLRLGSSAGPSFGFWDCDHDYRLPTFPLARKLATPSTSRSTSCEALHQLPTALAYVLTVPVSIPPQEWPLRDTPSPPISHLSHWPGLFGFRELAHHYHPPQTNPPTLSH